VKKQACSFLKKRTKKLLFFDVSFFKHAYPRKQKFFASFFQKRRPSFNLEMIRQTMAANHQAPRSTAPEANIYQLSHSRKPTLLF
jgi:predicted Zn-dependent peptidase